MSSESKDNTLTEESLYEAWLAMQEVLDPPEPAVSKSQKLRQDFFTAASLAGMKVYESSLPLEQMPPRTRLQKAIDKILAWNPCNEELLPKPEPVAYMVNPAYMSWDLANGSKCDFTSVVIMDNRGIVSMRGIT